MKGRVKVLVVLLALFGASAAAIVRAQTFSEFPVPTASSQPLGIAVGPDGALWFTEFVAHKIGRITTAGVTIEFPVHPSGGFFSYNYPGGIASGPDGALWFAEDYKIGRMTTDGAVTEFAVPGASTPINIALGPDGALWFTEINGLDSNDFGRISTDGVFTEFTVPTGDAILDSIALGPDGALWFTDSSGNRIVRFGVAGATCTADARTLCLNSGRFQVRARWQAPSHGTSGQGTAVPLTADTGDFWFFDSNNIEVVVKVLNGCSGNGHYLVFAGGLTNVGVTITVTDTQTGLAETYSNPAGTAFQPIQDTTAFSTCP